MVVVTSESTAGLWIMVVLGINKKGFWGAYTHVMCTDIGAVERPNNKRKPYMRCDVSF